MRGRPRNWVQTAARVLAVLGALLAAAPAMAHKLNVFASAEGRVIRGEVYARGGDPIRDATVTALGPGGEKLGQTTTDDAGEFALEARYRCDHRLVVDGGGGHLAEYTVPAEELPGDLPAPSGEAESATEPTARTESTAPPAPEHAAFDRHDIDRHDIAAKLEALERQIVQLRKQLDGYEEKVRLHDILGGVGYILGLMGLGYYLLGRRRSGSEG